MQSTNVLISNKPRKRTCPFNIYLKHRDVVFGCKETVLHLHMYKMAQSFSQWLRDRKKTH